jgi:phosphatidylinositol 3,5-bisphosphate 5-phosphatase
LGSNQNETHNRILKIDRTIEPGQLGLAEDDVVYTRKGAAKVLEAIADGNKASGGLTKVLTAWGIIGAFKPLVLDLTMKGFIRFTAGYYMSVITKRSPVALLGGHYVYHIDETRLISIASEELRKAHKHPEEARYLSTLDHLDISKTFYFSYSYDITRTLQSNILRQRALFEQGKWYGSDADVMSYNDMFVWNHYLLKSDGANQLREMANWCVPIIHGFVDQASIFAFFSFDLMVEISLYGRSIYVCVIARRSRYFAGARFLKRGVNDKVVS